jgi:hypothetical protein
MRIGISIYFNTYVFCGPENKDAELNDLKYSHVTLISLQTRFECVAVVPK